MATRACLFVAAFLSASVLHHETAPELVVWNVGQGQWATLIYDDLCWHFDTGGEFAPWRKIREQCRGRVNRVSLSHWDQDHVGFLGRALNALPSLCRAHSPFGPASIRKIEMLERVPLCRDEIAIQSWVNPEGRTANDRSWVHVINNILIPGDSPKVQEKHWRHHLPLAPVNILILGHHGSRTSTSRELLFDLKNLRVAISSVRFRRYRHPHPETVVNLAKRKIPLLRTEEWGNIHLLL